jgi:hypothetical protein
VLNAFRMHLVHCAECLNVLILKAYAECHNAECHLC